MHRSTTLRWPRWVDLAGLALLVLGPGCGLRSDDDEDPVAGAGTGEPGAAATVGAAGGDRTDGETITEGIEVLPMVMLHDVPAVVTRVGPQGSSQPCVPHGPGQPGYLCDTAGLDPTDVTLLVERDGFDPASATVAVPPGVLLSMPVHLVAEGGGGAAWSSCVEVTEFVGCHALCETGGQGCAAASCAVAEAAGGGATFQGFATAACDNAPVVEVASACLADASVVAESALWARCCCAP